MARFYFAKRPTPFCAAVLAIQAGAPTALAQTPREALEEVVVTATRREASVQDVPFNIAAVSADAIERAGLQNLNDLGRTVAGVYIPEQGVRNRSAIVVRGLSVDPVADTDSAASVRGETVSTYAGDVPLFVDLRLQDLERVEVLLGPQGTLYGAGTLAGAIRYIPQRPQFDASTLSLRADAFTINESDGVGASGGATFNVPFSDRFALRGTVNYLEDPGFTDYPYVLREPGVSNPQPDFSDPAAVSANLRRVEDADFQEVLSGRLALRFAVSEALDINLTHYYQDQQTDGRTMNNVESLPLSRYETGYRFLEPNDRTTQLTALELQADLGFAELTSATGYAQYEEQGSRDVTDLLLSLGVGYELFPSFAAYTEENQDDATFTQELRLVSKGEGPWNWILGAFYNDFDLDYSYREYAPGFSTFAVDVFGGIQERPDNLEYAQLNAREQEEMAVFGEIGYRLTEQWQVTVGARWFDYDLTTREGRDLPLFNTVFLGAPQDQVAIELTEDQSGDSGTLFKFNTSYDFTSEVMGYLTVSEGYRIGGSNGLAPCPDDPNPNQVCGLPNERFFEPDSTTSYEVGVRSQLLDGRLILNGAVYFIDWQDPRLAGITVNGGAGYTTNGEGAESQGVELSFDAALTERLRLSGNFNYTQAELSDPAPNLIAVTTQPAPPDQPGFGQERLDGVPGDRLPGSPETQGSLFVNYDVPLSNSLELGLNWGVFYTGDVITVVGSRGLSETLPSYSLSNASVELRSDRWRAALYANNVFDEYAETSVRFDRNYVYSFSDIDGNAVPGRFYGHEYIRPRQIGVRFSYDF